MGRGFIVAVAGLVLMLAACGDDSAQRAAKGAQSLQGMRVDGPPNTQWNLVEARVVDGRIIMEVGVDSGSATALRAVPRMQSSQIAQRACPSPAAEVWKFIDDEPELWVNLIDDEKKAVVETRCLEP